MKKRAGLATESELAALRSAWTLVGGTEPGSGALAAPPVCETTEEWLQRYGGPRRPNEHL